MEQVEGPERAVKGFKDVSKTSKTFRGVSGASKSFKGLQEGCPMTGVCENVVQAVVPLAGAEVCSRSIRCIGAARKVSFARQF